MNPTSYYSPNHWSLL